jgi:hypothetical protein
VEDILGEMMRWGLLRMMKLANMIPDLGNLIPIKANYNIEQLIIEHTPLTRQIYAILRVTHKMVGSALNG